MFLTFHFTSCSFLGLPTFAGFVMYSWASYFCPHDPTQGFSSGWECRVCCQQKKDPQQVFSHTPASRKASVPLGQGMRALTVVRGEDSLSVGCYFVEVAPGCTHNTAQSGSAPTILDNPWRMLPLNETTWIFLLEKMRGRPDLARTKCQRGQCLHHCRGKKWKF